MPATATRVTSVRFRSQPPFEHSATAAGSDGRPRPHGRESTRGIVDQFFAAHLDTGSIATLNYTNRILSLILGLGGTAVTRSMLPVFSHAHAQGDGRINLYRIATQWMWLLFALGILSVIVGWWLAPWVVEILFQRGAFTAQNAEAVSEVLRYGMTQFPFYFAGLVSSFHARDAGALSCNCRDCEHQSHH
jgi:peptidoglycan biosynthesis protein MviN/MurJ (putative lipid II flippase)